MLDWGHVLIVSIALSFAGLTSVCSDMSDMPAHPKGKESLPFGFAAMSSSQ
jgi:hypothetical protein